MLVGSSARPSSNMSKKPRMRVKAKHRRSPEYHEGVEAYNRGDSFEDCPHVGEERIGWHTGWLDAKSDDKFGDLFRDNGVSTK